MQYFKLLFCCFFLEQSGQTTSAEEYSARSRSSLSERENQLSDGSRNTEVYSSDVVGHYSAFIHCSLFHAYSCSFQEEHEVPDDNVESNEEAENFEGEASDSEAAEAQEPDQDDETEDPSDEDGEDEMDAANIEGNDAGQNRNEPRAVLLNNPFCPCTTTTEGDALLMCLALGMRHNMTWVAMVDMLDMINKLYGTKVVASSKHFLMKYFDTDKDSAVVHIYCPTCYKYLGTQAFVRENNIAQCDCGEPVSIKGNDSSYFVSVKLESKLKSIMERPGVAEEIMTYRFQRRKEHEDNLEDVYDGEMYKRFSAPGGILAEGNNFSFTMNTDGMNLGCSSTRSAWPIFLYINELAPHNRKKHIVFAGIWVGQKHPNMNIFLSPFVDELNSLSTEGFNWTDGHGIVHNSKVIPLIAVLDSAARFKFLNLSNYSAYYGCTFCYEKGHHTSVGLRFPGVDINQNACRTHLSMLNDMRVAHANRNNANEKARVYKGCKGFTPLVRLHPYLDLGKGVIVDFLHNALLGVTRRHIDTLLTTTKTRGPNGKIFFKAGPFYIGSPENIHTINSILSSIKPPSSLSRTPRDISDYKQWKASEWRTFLLFYGLVCLSGILKQKYFEHFCMLSSAIYLILQKSISRVDLQTSHRYLIQYMMLVLLYFGEKSMVYNVHLLKHVIDAILNWGPAWGPNTFIFEGENRNLSQMNTSPGHVGLQLARRYRIFSSFPTLCEKLASSEKPLAFLEKITKTTLKNFVRCDGVVLVGRGTEIQLEQEEMDCLLEAGFGNYLNILSYQRFHQGRIRYTTRQYSRDKKNDDSWLKTQDGSRGSVSKILLVQFEDHTKVLILLQLYDISRQPVLKTRHSDPNLEVTLSHLKRIEGRGRLITIDPASIKQQCLHMNVEERGRFICDIPYGCYGD